MPSWLSLLRNGLAGTRNTHSGHSRLPSSHMSQHLTCDMDRLRWGFLVWLFQFLATQMARSQRPWPFSALSHARPFPFVGDAEFTKYSSPLRQFGGWGFFALRQQAVAAGSSSMDVVPLAAVFWLTSCSRDAMGSVFLKPLRCRVLHGVSARTVIARRCVFHRAPNNAGPHMDCNLFSLFYRRQWRHIPCEGACDSRQI